jgi:hypothetical protein
MRQIVIDYNNLLIWANIKINRNDLFKRLTKAILEYAIVNSRLDKALLDYCPLHHIRCLKRT